MSEMLPYNTVEVWYGSSSGAVELTSADAGVMPDVTVTGTSRTASLPLVKNEGDKRYSVAEGYTVGSPNAYIDPSIEGFGPEDVDHWCVWLPGNPGGTGLFMPAKMVQKPGRDAAENFDMTNVVTTAVQMAKAAGDPVYHVTAEARGTGTNTVTVPAGGKALHVRTNGIVELTASGGSASASGGIVIAGAPSRRN